MRKEKNISFPDCWDELTTDEWVYLLDLRQALQTHRGVSLQDVRRAWCFYVLAHRGYKFHRDKALHTDEMNLVERLTETLSWMWLIDDEEGCIALRFNTTKNLFPKWKKLIGPASHGADLTFGEFRAATAAMNLYTQDHMPSDLLALVAILYRKPGEHGKRLPFDTDRLPEYMQAAKDMPAFLQWGVYAWFAYFCEYLLTGAFVIDGNEVTFAPVFGRRDANAPQASGQDLGLNSILYTVAESGVFGTADDTDRTPLLRVLLKLLDDKQRADEMLKRIKNK